MELHHANAYDSEWATGIGLNDKDLFKKAGPGKNLLGQILMNIRDNSVVGDTKTAMEGIKSHLSMPHLQGMSDGSSDTAFKINNDNSSIPMEEGQNDHTTHPDG